MDILAPAKLNLYLHIIGKRTDGYHNLDSLMAFTDIGDRVIFEPANEFAFKIEGPFSKAFKAQEMLASEESKNLAVKAVWLVSKKINKKPDFRLTLIKNLPLASGLGGGSSDAASVLWGLSKIWGLSKEPDIFENIAFSLGADVPACFLAKTVRATGIGDVLDNVPDISDFYTVLVNVKKHSSTQEIFSNYHKPLKEVVKIPENLNLYQNLIDFLSSQENDLESLVIDKIPEISTALSLLDEQDGCSIARMSGSGATCFGLFENENDALNAAENILFRKPDWWVRASAANRVDRY
jgi:4-diphosphocytidyl-2-C-methyl-D-erythritol kinase